MIGQGKPSSGRPILPHKRMSIPFSLPFPFFLFVSLSPFFLLIVRPMSRGTTW